MRLCAFRGDVCLISHCAPEKLIAAKKSVEQPDMSMSEPKVPKFKRCKISRQQLVILMKHFGACVRPARCKSRTHTHPRLCETVCRWGPSSQL